ncbi:MAG: hypothetical protein J5892_05315 [Bacilli bacterium]|nr:hypothetical protein [Bacilli bacterium]
MKYVSLKGEKLDVSINNYYEYLSPNYVFIPYHAPRSVSKKNLDKIYKEELLLEGTYNYYSNISGYIRGFKDFNNYLNVNEKYIVIENDYKEKYLNKKNINKDYLNTKKIDLINKLKEYKSFYTAKILDFLETHEIIDNIIVIGFDDDLYNYANRYYLEKDITKIFDAISLLTNVLDLNQSYLLIKDNNSKLINNIVDFEGSYPNIKVNYLPDIYPLSCKAILKNYTKTYYKINSLVINLEELLIIYDIIYRNKYHTEKVISITDLVNKKVSFCYTKTYVLIASIIKDFPDNAICYINNPLNSNVIDINTTVLTPDVNAIIIDKKLNYIENPCINCGKCEEVCPLKLKDLTSSPECIKCNLCSYMCPSNINLLENKNE